MIKTRIETGKSQKEAVAWFKKGVAKAGLLVADEKRLRDGSIKLVVKMSEAKT